MGTVFVDSAFPRKGIGNLLLNEMYWRLANKGIEEFCLDSGYIVPKKSGKRKPDYLLEDFWGEGFHHMIWRVKVEGLFE